MFHDAALFMRFSVFLDVGLLHGSLVYLLSAVLSFIFAWWCPVFSSFGLLRVALFMLMLCVFACFLRFFGLSLVRPTCFVDR